MIETKASIRSKLLKKRQKLPQKDVEIFSKRILSRLASRPEYKHARTILLYHPINNEVDTISLVKHSNKIFCLPRICKKTNHLYIHQFTDPHTLETGKFSIKEPSSKHPRIARNRIDLVITPGLAFDPQGNRIGYGKGYFDRLFKSLSTKCTKIALAYDFQIVENVPADKHDQKVDFIITEKRTINP